MDMLFNKPIPNHWKNTNLLKVIKYIILPHYIMVVLSILYVKSTLRSSINVHILLNKLYQIVGKIAIFKVIKNTILPNYIMEVLSNLYVKSKLRSSINVHTFYSNKLNTIS